MVPEGNLAELRIQPQEIVRDRLLGVASVTFGRRTRSMKRSRTTRAPRQKVTKV